MIRCDYCGHNIEGLPWKCKYCGRTHCGDHRLPESHDCDGLKAYKEKNSERWRSNFVEEIQDNDVKKIKGQERVRYYFQDKISSIKHWLNRREHHAYDYERRLSFLVKTILILSVSVIGFAIFYSNARKLNSIEIWIIQLAGVLLLISLFFSIKYSWRLLGEGGNWFKRQKNWLKYLIIIVFIILLWQAYTHKEDVLNPVFEIYNETNFTLFIPIDLGNFSFDSSSYQSDKLNINNKNPSTSNSGGAGLMKLQIEM